MPTERINLDPVPDPPELTPVATAADPVHELPDGMPAEPVHAPEPEAEYADAPERESAADAAAGAEPDLDAIALLGHRLDTVESHLRELLNLERRHVGLIEKLHA